MSIVMKASNLDVRGWLRGLLSAGISSAGGAFSAGFGPAVLDPNVFNLAHPAMIVKSALIGAGVAGAISMAKFLQSQPLPEMKEVTAMRQVVTPATPDNPSTTIDTVKETRIAPIDTPTPALPAPPTQEK